MNLKINEGILVRTLYFLIGVWVGLTAVKLFGCDWWFGW